jgi:hypothetical protein
MVLASAVISLAATVASAGGTLLGASGFFSLYNNLYIGPTGASSPGDGRCSSSCVR